MHAEVAGLTTFGADAAFSHFSGFGRSSGPLTYGLAGAYSSLGSVHA